MKKIRLNLTVHFMPQSSPKKIAVFFPVGDSFRKLSQSGQTSLMISSNLIPYSKAFKKLWIFTYEKEKINLPSNCRLVEPPINIHRYIYAILLPIIHRKILLQTDLIRCFHISAVVPALIAKIFFKNKYIFNYGYDYSSFAHIEGKKLQLILFAILHPIATRFASSIIIKNLSLLKAINHDLHSKTSYIPNGVDTKQFSPGKVKKDIDVLFVGRLEPQKNILMLVKAMKKIKSKKLTMIGNGSLFEKAASQAFIHKSIPNHKLPSYYRRAKIFVLPSVKEGSPKVLLEAMACGLACIASDISEHREIIVHNKNGVLVQPSANSLATQITKLIRHPSIMQKLGVSARQTIINRFDHTNLIDQETKLMQSI